MTHGDKHDKHGNHSHAHQGEHDGHSHGPLPYFKGRFGLPFRPNYKILILIAIALFMLYVYRNIVVLVVLLILIMVYDFLIHFFHFPIHVDPMPFASFFVSTQYGLPVAILFILIGEILPEMLVGHFEIADFFNFVPLIIVNIVLFATPPANFYGTAFVGLIIYIVINAVIAFFSASPFHKFTIEPVLDFVINIVLVLRVAPILFFITGTHI